MKKASFLLLLLLACPAWAAVTLMVDTNGTVVTPTNFVSANRLVNSSNATLTGVTITSGSGDGLTNLTRPFTLAVIPDAQYLAKTYTNVYPAMTGWLVTNSSILNLKAVIGLGDIVDAADSNVQWLVASNALKVIDAANIPNVNPPGNHDYDLPDINTRGLLAYNTNFPLSRYTNRAWYGGTYTTNNSANMWIKLDMGSVKLLILTLEFGPTTNEMVWANSIVTNNLDRMVILVTHSYMYIDNTRSSPGDAYNPHLYFTVDCHDGEDIWQKWAKYWPNLRMVLSGHELNGTQPAIGRLTSSGVYGNPVMQMLSDYQDFPAGGAGGGGMLRLLQFTPDNRVYVSTFSTSGLTNMTDTGNQFSFSLNSLPTSDMVASNNIVAFNSKGELSDSGTALSVVTNTVSSLTTVSNSVTRALSLSSKDGLVFGMANTGTSTFDYVSGAVGTNTLAIVTNGLLGPALEMTNSYVAFPPLAYDEISASLWYKRTFLGDAVWVSQHTAGANGVFYFGCTWSAAFGNYVPHIMLNNAAGVRADLYVTNYVADTNWHHAAFTYSTNTTEIKVWSDGVLCSGGSTNLVGPLFRYTDAPLLLGAYWNGGSPGLKFAGTLAKVKVWNRALGAREITSIYNAEKGDNTFSTATITALTAGNISSTNFVMNNVRVSNGAGTPLATVMGSVADQYSDTQTGYNWIHGNTTDTTNWQQVAALTSSTNLVVSGKLLGGAYGALVKQPVWAGTNVVLDVAAGQVFSVLLTNHAHIWLTNATSTYGKCYTLKVKQDAVGGWALTFETNQANSYFMASGGIFPTATTNASAQDIYTFVEDYSGTNMVIVQTPNVR